MDERHWIFTGYCHELRDEVGKKVAAVYSTWATGKYSLFVNGERKGTFETLEAAEMAVLQRIKGRYGS